MMGRRWRMVGGILAGLLSGVGTAATLAAEPEEAVFPMREISVLEEAEKTQTDEGPYQHQALLSGQYAFCGNTPHKQVKKYPKLHSRQPLYGSVKFGGSQVDPTAGITFYFVIDESESAKTQKTEPAAKKPKKRSLLKALVESLTGPSESPDRGPRTHYDRLYFDASGDLDLTNDPVLKPMKDPPKALVPEGFADGNVRVFDYLDVPLDHGPGLGKRPFRIVVQLYSFGPGQAQLSLLPAVARKGKIRIGKQEYTALLTQSDTITGRFDRPYTKLLLTPVGGSPKRASGWWGDWLCTMRRVDGQLYGVSATPGGDKLIVKPYRGEYGLLKVGPSDGKIKKRGAAGVLVAKKEFVVPVGELSYPMPGEKPAQSKLPVGDYLPLYLAVDYGRVALRLSPNTYTADGSEDQPEKPPAHNIEIRKDKPFVLDFSEEPTVLFTGPPKKRTFKPGDKVPFEAVLVDTKLDLMISGLEDTTDVTGKMEFRDEEGNPVSIPRYRSLDPTVTIKDSSGKEVASGKMPFG